MKSGTNSDKARGRWQKKVLLKKRGARGRVATKNTTNFKYHGTISDKACGRWQQKSVVKKRGARGRVANKNGTNFAINSNYYDTIRLLLLHSKTRHVQHLPTIYTRDLMGDVCELWRFALASNKRDCCYSILKRNMYSTCLRFISVI